MSTTDKTPPKAEPFKSTRTKTYEITGPIKIIITDDLAATHVPPLASNGDCGCGGSSGGGIDIGKLLNLLAPFLTAFTPRSAETYGEGEDHASTPRDDG